MRTREKIVLWFSYNRYALLILALIAAGGLLIASYSPAAWYAWTAWGLLTAKFTPLMVSIFAKWPKKIRATYLCRKRMQSGRFRPETVRNYCGDPCFRVVAKKLLRESGMTRSQIAPLVTRYAEEMKEASTTLVFVDEHGRPSVRI